MAKKFDLGAAIDEATKLDQRMKKDGLRVGELKDQIKAELVKRGLEEFSAGSGVACMSTYTSRTYDAEKVKAALAPSDYDEVCPRKVDGTKMAALLKYRVDVAKALLDSGAVTETTDKRLSLKPKTKAKA